MRTNSLLAALLALSVLGGCATPVQPLGTPDVVEPPGVDGVDLLGAASTGARVPFAAKGLPGLTEVVVGRPYTAASGRRCRPLANTDGIALGRVVCESEGRWRLVRSLEPRGGVRSGEFEPRVLRTIVPSGGAELSDAMASLHIERIVKGDRHPDQVLRSFAERVTVEGRSWRRIATLSGIDGSTSHEFVRRLAVPVELPRD